MANEKRILIYGDPHLSSKNYGSHVNYPKESLDLFKNILKTAKDLDCGTLIGLGDLTYGKFHDLDYVLEVENELEAQKEWTNNNHYMLKGNHDVITNGKSVWEFYLAKGAFKNVPYIDRGCSRIHLVNYNEAGKPLAIADGKENIVLGHDYFRYSNSVFTKYYGNGGIVLDNHTTWRQVDLIIAGHIHEFQQCSGCVITGETSKTIPVIYPGCPTRPALQENLDTKGRYIILDCSGDNVMMTIHEFDLPALEDIFLVKQVKNTSKEPLIDVSDIIRELVAHERITNDPEVVINSLNVFSEEVRAKAIQLYREALN